MIFNPTSFKKQFPLFSQQENQSLVYLDNAATTHKPQCVIDAISYFYTHTNANAQRSSHRLARAATELLEQTRLKAKRFLNASDSNEVIFTSGATESLNIIAYGLRPQLCEKDEIVLTVAEHHANLLPWQETAKSTGAKLLFSTPDLATLGDVVNHNTKVIAVTAASNGLGVMADFDVLMQIKALYPDIIIAVDASQIVAHQIIDVQKMPCDFLVCSAHKFYGPTGVGLLYGKQALLNQLPPLRVGGEMAQRVGLYSSQYAQSPARFEAGTSSLSAIAGLGACIDFLQRQDRQQIHQHEVMLIQRLHTLLKAINNPLLHILTYESDNIGIATLSFKQPLSVIDTGYWLDEHDIAVRVGRHCAHPLWQYLDTGDTLRVSLAAYNTKKDVDQFVQCLSDFLVQSGKTVNDSVTTPAPAILGEVPYDDVSHFNWQELLSTSPWNQRYKCIMRWGKAISYKGAIRKDQYRIAGCESAVWLSVFQRSDHYYFLVDSDSNMIKGLAVLILCRVQGRLGSEIQAVNFFDYFKRLELTRYLSESRLNGFGLLLKTMLSQVNVVSD